MKPGFRLGLLGMALVLFAGFYCAGLRLIPAVGEYRGPYGIVIDAIGQGQRNVTDMVSAVNFDYRAIDTVGEEYILFISVTGAVVVLRRVRGEMQGGFPTESASDKRQGRRAAPTSDAVRLSALVLVAPCVVLGLYIVSHGQLSPGGGFQGGAILTSALLLVFLAGRYRRLRRIGPIGLDELADALGAGGFVGIGVAGLVAAGALLANVLPLGTSGDLTAGGTIPLISVSIGVEVGGGLLVILSELLEQTLQIREAGGGQR
jgi:multicomponent Na+:H+ antiporter subunit B